VRYRKLRIAWSVFWGIACVLLIGLWVRSYHTRDFGGVRLTTWQYLRLDSKEGQVNLSVRAFDGTADPHRWWRHTHTGFPSYDLLNPEGQSVSKNWFQIMRWKDRTEVLIPYWFIALSSVAIASLTWIRWRFNLCTLLIATTLVAVVLGVIVWSVG
jgi:hypothetical protein